MLLLFFIFIFSLSFFPSRTYEICMILTLIWNSLEKRAIYLACATMPYTTIYITWPFTSTHPPPEYPYTNVHQIHLVLLLDAQISTSNVTNVKYSGKSGSGNGGMKKLVQIWWTHVHIEIHKFWRDSDCEGGFCNHRISTFDLTCNIFIQHSALVVNQYPSQASVWCIVVITLNSYVYVWFVRSFVNFERKIKEFPAFTYNAE